MLSQLVLQMVSKHSQLQLLTTKKYKRVYTTSREVFKHAARNRWPHQLTPRDAGCLQARRAPAPARGPEPALTVALSRTLMEPGSATLCFRRACSNSCSGGRSHFPKTTKSMSLGGRKASVSPARLPTQRHTWPADPRPGTGPQVLQEADGVPGSPSHSVRERS